MLLLLSLSASAAERLTVRVGPLSGVETERMLGVCESVVRELTGLSVVRGLPVSSSSRCGGREDCLLAMARESGTEHMLVVEVVPRRQVVVDVDVAWVDTVLGGVSRRSVTGVPPSTVEKELRATAALVMPAFVRKGWGGVVVPGGARLRVDGRMTGPDEVLALTAGPHEVDLLPSSGRAVLFQEEIVEGTRLRLAPGGDPGPSAGASETGRGQGVRVASAVTFSLGALAVASALVAGGLSRSALGGLRPCTDTSRDCSSFSEAGPAYARSGSEARVGNVLLGVGAGLTGVGIGLFVFDLLATPSER